MLSLDKYCCKPFDKEDMDIWWFYDQLVLLHFAHMD